MQRSSALVLALLGGAHVAALAQRPETGTITYEIAFPNAAHNEAEVTVTFPRLGTQPLSVRMGRSSPGRYAVHEFAKNVYHVRAEDGSGRALVAVPANPHQWNIAGHNGTVRFSYTLYGDQADGTYAGIDRTQAHLNMPATFAWARGMENRPIRVTFRLPDSTWSVATQLFATPDRSVFTAPNFQYFMDSPTHLGKLSWYEWPVTSNGRTQTIRVALHHLGTKEEEQRYVDATKKIVDAQARIFGGLPTFDGGTYTFLSVYLPWAFGDGMEHRNSTSLTSSASLAQAMNRLLGTVSHEFFHIWNVERIRPKSLEPFNFEDANMSGELWLAEGFTNYYGPLAMRRAGLTTVDDFARGMGAAVNTVTNTPGRAIFSAVGMSQQAPFTDAATSIDAQNKQNTFISYYTYGQVVALALDLTLRARTPSATLDDFMREMWRVHGEQKNYAPVRPYTLADVEHALATVSKDPAFAREFMGRYIAGHEIAPLDTLLAQGGLELRKVRANAAWIGAPQLRFDGGRAMVVSNTIMGSPIYLAGLDRGDRLISFGGRAINAQVDLDQALDGKKVGDKLPVTFESHGRIIESTLTIGADPRLEIVTYESAGKTLTESMRAFREAWLGR